MPRLVVVALGGNAIAPPTRRLDIGAERVAVRTAVEEIAGVLTADGRALIVHGNGPQVGRLLGDPGDLDVHVAQTQGELGYLLAQALDAVTNAAGSAAVVTRVAVDPADPAFAHPAKPIGPVLDTPAGEGPLVRTPDGRGWRRVVPSPRPVAIVELEAIRALLATHHVVAGGGGGIPVEAGARAGRGRPAVVDKDWVAALLGIALEAAELLFVTDVSCAFERFATAGAQPIRAMTVARARALLADGVFAPGSMAPKVESAVQFVEATARRAVIAGLGEIRAALEGLAGTTVRP
ncbi:MAG: carbamate kinase [Candidatus Rokubacteria bacterium]|nr:carbamate kinase [Candidatus Rokubacteria bacterium]